MKDKRLLHVLSDLHLEFLQYNWDIPETESDVIILAGDIGVGTSHKDWMIRQLEIHNKPIIYVLGNHEFYHQNISTVRNDWKQIAENHENLYFLDDNSAVIDGVIYFGATLWSMAETPEQEGDLNWGMNDFNIVEFRGKKFRASDANILHKQSFDYIRKMHEDTNEHDKVVVITHHSPSFKSTAKMFEGSSMNCGFATDLEWFIEESNIDVWIHGHMHNQSDYMINNTRIVANPKGYPREQRYGQSVFNPELIIEV